MIEGSPTNRRRSQSTVLLVSAALALGACSATEQDAADEFVSDQGGHATVCRILHEHRAIDSQLVIAAVGREWFVDRGADPEATAQLVVDGCQN